VRSAIASIILWNAETAISRTVADAALPAIDRPIKLLGSSAGASFVCMSMHD